MIIKLYELFNCHALRQRESAHKVAEMIVKQPDTVPITIDFSGIDFATHSFLNQLLSDLYYRKNVVYINYNENVREMMKISFKPPSSDLRITA